VAVIAESKQHQVELGKTVVGVKVEEMSERRFILSGALGWRFKVG